MSDQWTQRLLTAALCVSVIFVAGCTTSQGNVGHMAAFQAPSIEAEWIRNGEPIKFEGRLWRPQDSVDVLTDAEVYLVGEHEGVQFFIERVDVKPYDKLYTKFDINKFRVFLKINQDDKSQ